MSDPEYRHIARAKREEGEKRAPSWLERFFDWLFRNRADRVDASALSWGALVLRALAYLVALVIFVLIAFVIVRGFLKMEYNMPRRPMRSGTETLISETPPGELPADEYVRRAIELAGSGDYKAAIRELLLGTMSWTERAGLIRFRRGLTNRDYLRAVWRRPACRDSMSEIVDAFDRTYFGRRAATLEMFNCCLDRYRLGFTGNEKAALAS